MIGRLVDVALSINGRQRVTVELREDFRESYSELKDVDVDIEIKKHRERRSLSANAYFHVLVNKIARRLGESEERVKKKLVTEYGALAKDDNGMTIGFKLPETTDVDVIYPYTKCFDERVENGITFNCYLVYKQTHLMDTQEMAHLIDGAIDTAKELGVQTDTPAQIAKYKEYWKRGESNA